MTRTRPHDSVLSDTPWDDSHLLQAQPQQRETAMMRLFLCGIAAAALLASIASAPATEQNLPLRKDQAIGNSSGNWSAGPHEGSARTYSTYRDRSGFGLRQKGGGAVNQGYTGNQGWGCPACGFKNGTKLNGLDAATQLGPVVTVILPSGDLIDLRGGWNYNTGRVIE